ncbi:MAG: phospholipase/carboxylesterase [Solirubrobacteraceae bacterium]|nr:phospholipase/carboxylesterase [Solirubrobacteraceae bacterium]
MSANPNLSRGGVVHAGVPLDAARRVAVLVHGRDQDEQLMLDVVARLSLDDVAYLLPVAAQRTWYPGRYFDPLAENEPHLGWALEAIEHAIGLATHAGLQERQIVLGGFSQGACLVAHLVAWRPRPLAGLAVLTGVLLGAPEQRLTPHDLLGLTVYASCSVHDAWIPIEDARATAEAFVAAGADVDFEQLDDREHLVSDRAVTGLRRLLTVR